MSDLQLARTAAATILDLHEKVLRAAEGGPAAADEWAKLRADYVSVCSTTAAIVAAAFQDMGAGEVERLRCALRSAADELENAARRTTLTHTLLSRELRTAGEQAHRAALTPIPPDTKEVLQ